MSDPVASHRTAHAHSDSHTHGHSESAHAKPHAGSHHKAEPAIVRGGADDAPRAAAAKAPIPTTFAEIGLCAPVLKALTDEGYTVPTPIQAQAIPPLMAGHDMLGCAQTGTGKTAAFALPILHRLQAMPRDKSQRGPHLPKVLVLSPTRELATQIGESFAAYGRHTSVSGTIIFGGVSQGRQVRAIRAGVDVLVATPGRLIDLLEQGEVDLSQINILVLDEADRMLDMGFIAPIRKIVSKLHAERQTMLFSATMPKEIVRLADSLLKNPVKVSVTPVSSAAPKIEQSLYMVPKMTKPAMLIHLLEESKVQRAVVFTKTKHGADRLQKRLVRAGVSATAIHGNKAQNQRDRALLGFKTGKVRVLVATDVAARGLDVDAISHVFNFDLPMDPEAYVHRIGRTGRAGATGIAISFCDREERGLMRDIERLTGKKFNPIVTLPDLPTDLVDSHAHQDDERDDERPQRSHGYGHSHAYREVKPHATSGHRGGHATHRDHAPAKPHAAPAHGSHPKPNSSHPQSGTHSTHRGAHSPSATKPSHAPRSSSGHGAGHSGTGHSGTKSTGHGGHASKGNRRAGKPNWQRGGR
jgi:ATP-dependent RNA helicase RhlE